MSRPTLSVIVPNYNHARFLPELLASVLSQSYAASEIIILDDASTDESIEVIEEFARQDSRIRVLRNECNLGVERSVNRLLELATGDYVFGPSADDKVLPGFFEKSMSLLAEHPQAGLCSTVAYLIAETGEIRGVRSLPVISHVPRFLSPGEVRACLHRYGRWIDSGSVIYRRRALEEEGRFRPELGSYSDSFANLVLALRHGACFVPEPLSCWRQMAGGYAARSGADWKGLLRRGRSVVQLMQTTYKELFPIEYVTDFERHWLYMVSRNAQRQVLLSNKAAIGEAVHELDSSKTLSGWALDMQMRVLNIALALSWTAYSFLRFAPWRWWIMGRLSIVLNLRKVVLAEKLAS